MTKINTSPLSGFMELTPTKQARFNYLKTLIATTYAEHGFLNIETPTIDRTEVLLAKAGGETKKQVFFLDRPDKDEALRYDLTVPLSRYVVEYRNDLAFPFKATQIGKVYRGERAQRGRFREFYQCDVDIIGRTTLDLAYDADVISTVTDVFTRLNISDFYVRISNRKILSGFLQALNLADKTSEISNIIDHAEKVPQEATKSSLKDLGITTQNIEKIIAFTEIRGDKDTISSKFTQLSIDNLDFTTGVNELKTVMSLLAQQGLREDQIIADMLIIRGLDYYTGTVFETLLTDYPEIGSVASGGRYENLASNFTNDSFPGVGMSIGLTRLFFALNEKNLLPATSEKPLDIAIIPLSEAEYEFSYQTAKSLRQTGKKVDIIFTDKKLGDKLGYAAKIAEQAIIIGENEVKTGIYELRPLS